MKNALIIGANRGIGLELVKQLSERGDRVYAACRKVSSDLKNLGVHVLEDCEVSDESKLKKTAEQIEGREIDVMIHVAGIMKKTDFKNFDPKDIEKQLQVNSIGPLLSMRSFESLLSKGAKIGFISSRMGSIGDNSSGGSYGYRMSKAALNAAVKSLAMDFQDSSWTIFSIHPGYVETDMTGHKGNLSASESASNILELFDKDDRSQLHGRFYHCNGEELPW